MSTPTLSDSLRSAWIARYVKASNVVLNGAQAPGLFKPETVAQAEIDLAEGELWLGYWGRSA